MITAGALIEVLGWLGAVLLDAELAREPERRHAVDEAEVDGLGRPPLIRGHLRERCAEDLRRGCLVDVWPPPLSAGHPANWDEAH